MVGILVGKVFSENGIPRCYLGYLCLPGGVGVFNPNVGSLWQNILQIVISQPNNLTSTNILTTEELITGIQGEIALLLE